MNRNHHELLGPFMTQQDFPKNTSFFCVKPELKTIATQVNKSDLKKKSWWKRLLFLIIKWCRLIRVPRKFPGKAVHEFCGLGAPVIAKQNSIKNDCLLAINHFPSCSFSKKDQKLVSSPLKTSNVASTFFCRFDESVCTPLVVSTACTDLLENIGGTPTFDVNFSKKIKLRVLKGLIEKDAQLKTVEKRLENLENKLNDLIHAGDSQKTDCKNAENNFIKRNLPAFTSSISDVVTIQKYLRKKSAADMIENTSFPNLQGDVAAEEIFDPALSLLKQS